MDTVTLLEAVCQKQPDSSRTRVREWIRSGRVTVDGQIVTETKQTVGPKQRVQLEERARRRKEIQGIAIIYEDKHLLVVDKPAGLLSVSTDQGGKRNLHGLLKQYCAPYPIYPVHRLDRDTSGLLVFAKGGQVRKLFREAFAERKVKRVYVALAEGEVESEQGSWESYLSEDSSLRVHSGPERPGARWAKTDYRVVERRPQQTMLQLRLETGRKNQIRVHCSEAGHPLVGDTKYGAQTDALGRLGLHAAELAFTHPLTGKALKFESPVPKRFGRIKDNA